MLSTPLKILFFRNITYRLRFSFLQLGSWVRLVASCEVELTIAEMACVSRNIRRTFHVPSGVPVQRSISERDCSHPSCSRVRAHRPETLPRISARLQAVLCVILVQCFRSERSPSHPSCLI